MTARRGHAARRELPALLALAAAAVCLVPQVALLGKLPDHYDYWLQEYVHVTFLHRSLHAGELPLWNPQLVTGTPHLADPQAAVLYPLTTLPLLVLSPALVARISITFHYFLAGALTYGLARSLRLTRPAALAAGFAYALAPHLVPLEISTYIQQSAAWVPGILWALHRGFVRVTPGPFVVAGAMWALQLTRGYAQTWYLTGLIAGACCLTGIAWLVRRGERGGALRTAAWSILFGIGGLALGAAQLWPSLELFAASQRSAGFSPAEASGPGRVILLNLLGAAGPDAEVNGAFPGGVVLGLALAAALYSRRTVVWLLLAAGAVALALCLGNATPLWAACYRLIPGFSTVHMPHRLLFAWSLALALLAGLGIDALRGRPSLRPLALAALFASAALTLLLPLASGDATATRGTEQLMLGLLLIPAVFGASALWNRRRAESERGRARASDGGATGEWLPLALAALVAGDLLTYSAPRLHGRFFPPSEVYAEPASARWLQEQAQAGAQAGAPPFRFASAVYQPGSEYGENATSQDSRRLNYLPPNTAALFPGLEAAQGYLAIRLAQSGALFQAVNDLGRNPRTLSVYDPGSPLLGLLGVRYFVADDTATFPSRVGGGQSLLATDPAVHLPVRLHWPAAQLELLSSLGDSAGVPDGQQVAEIEVRAADSRTITLAVRAGDDTAEWMYDAPSVAGTVRHRLAPIAHSQAQAGGFATHVYRATYDLSPLGESRITSITLRALDPHSRWNVERVSLLVPFASRFRLAHADGPLHIWEAPDAFSRAWWVPSSRSVANDGEALVALADGSVDPSQTVLLVGSASSAATRPADVAHGSATVRWLGETANSASFEVQAPLAGWVVVSETYAPGWHASVDGQASTIVPADGGFEAIAVAAGEHHVSLVYRPASFVLGAWISGLTLFVFAGYGAWSIRRRSASPT